MEEYDTTTIIGKIKAAYAFLERGMPESWAELFAQVECEIEQLQVENEALKRSLMRLGEYTTQRLSKDELIRYVQKAIKQFTE